MSRVEYAFRNWMCILGQRLRIVFCKNALSLSFYIKNQNRCDGELVRSHAKGYIQDWPVSAKLKMLTFHFLIKVRNNHKIVLSIIVSPKSVIIDNDDYKYN